MKTTSAASFTHPFQPLSTFQSTLSVSLREPVGIALLPSGDSFNIPNLIFKTTIENWFPKIALNVTVGLVATEFSLQLLSRYGLRPAMNSSTLAVLLQSTDAITAAKTTEQMQQEAKDSGWLHGPDSEWVWGWPFYRMHFKICFENTTIDLGFNPILPGGGTVHAVGLEIFKNIEDDLATELGLDCLALFSSYVIAKALSLDPFTWAPAIGAILIKSIVQLAILWRDWSSPSKMLAAGLVGVLMALVATEASLATAFLGLLVTIVSGGTWNAISLIEGGLITAAGALQSMRTWTDSLEIVSDLMFALTAVAHYQGSI
jgi:hypothetical protein